MPILTTRKKTEQRENQQGPSEDSDHRQTAVPKLKRQTDTYRESKITFA